MITNIDRLPTVFNKMFYDIIRKREYTILNHATDCETRYPATGVIVLTAKDILKVSSPLLKQIHYIISHTEHSNKMRELILIQRLVNAGVKYSDACIKKIVNKTADLTAMISLLRLCMDIVKADYRDNLTMTDVDKAVKMEFGM
ncbi:hypothetical protein ACFL3G_13530 [Planctomycetota bacterium]